MSNPYEILGVQRNASNGEIKRAYKEIARKYHSSNFENNPLADIAKTKMEELNDAYDKIMEERSNASNTEGSYTQYSDDNKNYYSNFSGATQYPDVRKCIDRDRLDDALTILDGIPDKVRTAEWYYLKGVIQQKRGWLEEAYKNFKIAMDMDPYNSEYKNALKELVGFKRKKYYNYGGNGRRTARRSAGNCGLCNLCMGLVCLDSCCDCFGNGCC